ncbi:transcription termination/antitermination factor NusG [bacterium]|nr:transcription termination/antitermination factor NusG [FCB group bacterium]MBL7191294.1 transcription termination/antitermination factor NusG [bacterium]
MNSVDFQKQWFVVHVFTGQEEKIKNFLEQEAVRIGLQDRIGQILIPSEEVIEMRDGKKRLKNRVFFPGYLLVEMALDKETQHFIQNTPNVINFVGPRNRPEPLQKREIDRILGKADSAASQKLIEIPFKVDDTIKIIDGPFKDFTGFVTEINQERRKVKVMVSIFGRSTPVELDFLQITTNFRDS